MLSEFAMLAARASFFRRSYTAVDGLWFMMVEEALGFDQALALDAQVWRVMPKIQARQLKQLLGAAQGLNGLRECLLAKFGWEGFEASVESRGDEADPDGLTITLRGCPWLAQMRDSGREHLAGRIGESICHEEFAVWALEFGPGIGFQLASLACQNGECCQLRFERDRIASP